MRLACRVSVSVLALSVMRFAAAGEPPTVNVRHSKYSDPESRAILRTKPIDPDQYLAIAVTESCSDYVFSHQPLDAGEAAAGPLKRPSANDAYFTFTCILADLPTYRIPHDGTSAGYWVALRAPRNPTVALRMGKKKDRASEDPQALLATMNAAAKLALDACDKNPAGALEKCRDKAIRDVLDKEAGEGSQIVLLRDIDIMIATPASPIEVEFASAFTASFLVDPVYEVRRDDPTSASDAFRIRENNEARDRASLGAAAMVHVSPRFTKRHASLSFGLGVNNANRVDYYFGVSWRIHGQAFLTTGLDIGQISRLPNGIRAGDAVADANVLTALPKRTTGKLFVAISYTFLGSAKSAFTGAFEKANPTPAPPPAKKE